MNQSEQINWLFRHPQSLNPPRLRGPTDLIRRVYLSLLAYLGRMVHNQAAGSSSLARRRTQQCSLSFVAGHVLLCNVFGGRPVLWFTYYLVGRLPGWLPHKSTGDYVVIPIQIAFYCERAHFIYLVNYWSPPIVIFMITNKRYANFTLFWWTRKLDRPKFCPVNRW